jgi:hypothetical protein
VIRRAWSLLCLLTILAAAAMADGPTLNITPLSGTLQTGTTQLFSASFSDGSRVRQCVWNATGIPPNSMTPVGPNNTSAVFGAGTAAGQYVVTAVCMNNSGFTAVGAASVTVTPSQ